MTKQIQEALCKYLAEGNHEAICENFGYRIGEMDVVSISKSGMLHEFEVKISRSDFVADAKKRKWSFMDSTFHAPNYFNYVCPENLISKDEIPHYAGLYYLKDGLITWIKSAKRIHSTPHDREWILAKMLRLTIQRKYLGGAMLTVKNKAIREKYTEPQLT